MKKEKNAYSMSNQKEDVVSEVAEFIKLLQKIDDKKQRGVYMMICGASVLSETKKDIFE